MEESQYGKEKIEEYILGISDTPWPNKFLEELLKAIRELNQTFPDNEKIHVHPVDIYPDIHVIYDHLKVLQKKIGIPAESVEMPSFEEFEEWNKEEILVLIDTFIEVADNDSIINYLKTARASIQFYFADTVQFQTAIREKTIAKNVSYLLQNINTPVLALYGDWHAKKSSSTKSHPYTNSWANRLIKNGIKIYSLYATGITGTRLSPISCTVVPFSEDPEQVIFSDGTTLGTILDENPDCNIFYIDFLSKKKNKFNSYNI